MSFKKANEKILRKTHVPKISLDKYMFLSVPALITSPVLFAYTRLHTWYRLFMCISYSVRDSAECQECDTAQNRYRKSTNNLMNN